MSWLLRRNRCRRLSGPSSTSNGLLASTCSAAENSVSLSSAASCPLNLYNSPGNSVGTGPTPSGKPQILMAQNQTLHGLVEGVGIEMRPEREAGREPIGRIGGGETNDEPQRFLADRHVHPGTVDLDGIDGTGPTVGVDRLDDRGGDRGDGRPLQEF